MAETYATTIRPDAGFVRRIIENGGKTLKKCFQCGNCSVVCEISPDNEPFPRKEMIWAQWGLKDKLLSDGDVWLCHQCNDCSTHCPRGARPGDVMAAIRNIYFNQYSSSPVMALLMAKPVYLAALLLAPALAMANFISLVAKKGFLEIKPMQYMNMMPETAIDLVFVPAMIFSLGAAYLGVKSFWRQLNKNTPASGSAITAALQAARGVMLHEKLRKCVTNAPRATSHLLTMYGFIALMATTTMVAMLYWANVFGLTGFEYHQIGLSHPARLVVKLAGNIGALAAVTGVTLIIMRRYGAQAEKAGVTGYYDSHFIFILYITIITGILAELFRVADVAVLGFGVYFIHMVFVFALLTYAPFSKFAHLLYRFTALVHANMTQRDRARATAGI
jgi:quinone-modifying oxidoreductase subunit QmoC